MGRNTYAYDEANECRYAAVVLGADDVSCDVCPFPFCVPAEANIIQTELRAQLVRTLHKLGNSMEETAGFLGVSLRSVYRYAHVDEDVNCVQCNMIHDRDVMCKSDIYSVIHKDEQYIIVLNKHRHATEQESSIVRHLIDYAFPSSIVEQNDDCHDYWVLRRVELEEAMNFKRMCDALDKLMLSLGGMVKCLQHQQAI